VFLLKRKNKEIEKGGMLIKLVLKPHHYLFSALLLSNERERSFVCVLGVSYIASISLKFVE